MLISINDLENKIKYKEEIIQQLQNELNEVYK